MNSNISIPNLPALQRLAMTLHLLPMHLKRSVRKYTVSLPIPMAYIFWVKPRHSWSSNAMSDKRDVVTTWRPIFQPSCARKHNLQEWWKTGCLSHNQCTYYRLTYLRLFANHTWEYKALQLSHIQGSHKAHRKSFKARQQTCNTWLQHQNNVKTSACNCSWLLQAFYENITFLRAQRSDPWYTICRSCMSCNSDNITEYHKFKKRTDSPNLSYAELQWQTSWGADVLMSLPVSSSAQACACSHI